MKLHSKTLLANSPHCMPVQGVLLLRAGHDATVELHRSCLRQGPCRAAARSIPPIHAGVKTILLNNI